MIKKTIIIFIVFIIFMQPICINANSSNFSYDDFVNESQKYVNNFDVENIITNPSEIFNSLLSLFLNTCIYQFKEYLILFLLIILILFLISIMKSMVNANTVAEISEFGACIICCSFIGISFDDVSQIAVNAVKDLGDYMNVSFPGYAFLLASSGYGTTATSLQTSFIIISNIITIGINKIITPFLYSCALLGISNGITNSDEIANLIKTLIKFIKYVIGIIITIFSAILGFTGFVSSTGDSVIIKTAKYAISNFVPLVGNCLADTLNSLIYTSALLKNTVGYIGIIVILIISLSPVIKIFILSLVYKLLSYLSSLLLNKNLSATLDIVSNVVSTMGSVLILASVVFIIIIGIVLSAGV